MRSEVVIVNRQNWLRMIGIDALLKQSRRDINEGCAFKEA
jgi:hypothetical protein